MKKSNFVAVNIKRLRETCGYTQETVSSYLKIGRSAYANYEAGERETPLDIMEKLADLYGCDAYDLYDEKGDVMRGVLATAFRVDNLTANDMQQLAAFKRVVKSYLKMGNLLKK